MLHNKEYELINLFLGNYKTEIYGRSILDKVSISQKGIALALDALEQKGVLTSKKKGNLKFFSLNTKYAQLNDYLIIAEIHKKIQFLEKNLAIAHITTMDQTIVGIFGSYAKNRQKSDSDIDIFIIGKENKELVKNAKLFDMNLSVKHFTHQEFKKLLQEKNLLMNEIVEHHIILSNTEQFINDVWLYYYGFN